MKDTEKLDKILDNQMEMGRGIAVLETEIKNNTKVQDKHSKDIEGLKKFKWGIIGTAALTATTFIKSLFA